MTSPLDSQTPILVGAGQFTQRDVDPLVALSPLSLMEKAARSAAADAGVGAPIFAQVDSIAVVNIMSAKYVNAPRALAHRLESQARNEIYTPVGGNTPQYLVNHFAKQISEGRIRVGLIAGAEAFATRRLARRNELQLDWSDTSDGEPVVLGDDRPGWTQHEADHGLVLPTAIYPLFENALRAHHGWSIETHREKLGKLCERMSAVAARHKGAWFPQARSASEISQVTSKNRMVAFPYPKYMNAIMNVDQSAALLMMSVATARELGVDPSRWVFLHGISDALDHWHVSNRVNYYSSPAIPIAGQRALGMAGVGIGDIDYFDLYSCFPCAVQIGREMLGIAEDDPRELTVTGGLAYHGGPGNSYVTNSIATMMDQVRKNPGTKGLVTALGWFITKHSMSVYSNEPIDKEWVLPDASADQAKIDEMPAPEFVESAEGRGIIETYTVLHERDGDPSRGIAFVRLEDGRRALANTPNDRETLEALEQSEGVGVMGALRDDGGINRFDPNH